MEISRGEKRHWGMKKEKKKKAKEERKNTILSRK